jgi:hypothetical protein
VGRSHAFDVGDRLERGLLHDDGHRLFRRGQKANIVLLGALVLIMAVGFLIP